ncbi:hypothetical protein [Psychroflexus aestuariivivens]|uniref:hypothetical protein n=1 Tax=Psychroflexus aestuariivivens TaxID=1795040 RepID=UPI000FD918C1|nr:hypothetical protein [Psychroflexus aestuariivivens]
MKTIVTFLMFISLASSTFAENIRYSSKLNSEVFEIEIDSSEISVEKIFENYIKAIGGREKLKQIQSMVKEESMSTTTNFSGTETTMNSVMLMARDKSGKLASVTKSAGSVTKTVYTGNSGYTELSTGFKMDFDENMLALYDKPVVFFPELNPPESAEVSVKKLNGMEVFAVSYRVDDATQVTSHFDKNSWIKISEIIINNNSESIIEYQDWGEYDGIKVPIKTMMVTNVETGKMMTEMRTKIEFNAPIDSYMSSSMNDIARNMSAIPAGNSIPSSGMLSTATPVSEDAIDFENVDLSEIDEESFANFNKREQEYLLILEEQKKQEGDENLAKSNFVSATVESSGERSDIEKLDRDELSGMKYRRSSLYTLMVDDQSREHYNTIKDAFGNTELSEKFNNHNIGPYLIPGVGGENDQTQHIEDYLNANNAAKSLISKWFNRDENGNFNMDLVAERGQYDASDLNVKVAMESKRGRALLQDAGEELIGNTFVIVYDYKYTNKEEQAEKRGGFLNAVSTVASFVPGGEEVATVATLGKAASDVVGKGYFVRTTTYLYQLVWDEETANKFYSDFWIDESNFDENKKAKFESTDFFKLKYVGSEVSRNNLQSTIFTSKTNEELIEIATIRAVDKNISKLQRTFEDFRVKTPLLSGDPIKAKIGLKEGLEKGDKFEVLEQVLDEDGRTSYKRIGTIKVDKKQIWDNTFMAEEAENAEKTEDFTLFKGNSNKYASGMLIRQIN